MMAPAHQWPDCRYLGEEIGEKDCATCGRRVKLKARYCPFNGAGIGTAYAHAGHALPGVTADECRRCDVRRMDLPAPPANAPTAFLCLFTGYRDRESTLFLEPLARAGWNVVPVHVTRGCILDCVRKAIKTHGGPDAIVQWEEHGSCRTTAAWRDTVTWAYANGVAPLAVDFGYFAHYRQFMFDLYRPDGSSSIEDDWADVPATDPAWADASIEVRHHRDAVIAEFAAARDKPPLVAEPYVALYLQQYTAHCRLPHVPSNAALVARAASELAGKGIRLAVKVAPKSSLYAAAAPPANVSVFTPADAPDINAQLAVHAEYCMTLSSSISNEFLLAGLPVVALGRSWFCGKDVFREPASWRWIPDRAPAVNTAARNKYANWWLSRQFDAALAGPHFARLVERFRAPRSEQSHAR